MEELIAALREHLEDQLTQYVAAPGLAEPPGGDSASHEVIAERLRATYAVVTTIEDAYDAATVETWLFGTNGHLDDRAPIDVLRGATEPRTLELVRGAATAFVDTAG